MPSSKRIAVWLSDKKLQKMNWQEFETICNENGFEVFRVGNLNLYYSLHQFFIVFQVNIEKSLQSQEPFSVLVHKLTDIIASAKFGDIKVCIHHVHYKEKLKELEKVRE